MILYYFSFLLLEEQLQPASFRGAGLLGEKPSEPKNEKIFSWRLPIHVHHQSYVGTGNNL